MSFIAGEYDVIVIGQDMPDVRQHWHQLEKDLKQQFCN